MTDIKFVERDFIDKFMITYDTSGEYDYTILFDDYFEDFLQNASEVYLNNILKHYYSKKEIKEFKMFWENDIKTIASMQLYTKMFETIEKNFEEKHYSDADTDIE